MVEIKDTLGLWQRSLIAWPDGREDRTTFVAWLQGPRLFADLRQPTSPPSFDGVTCLNDLEPRHFDWLARQEGFAGLFAQSDDAFEWRRTIDFQCPSGAADAGYLAFSNGILIERGRDVPYIEHWHHTSSEFDPHFALQMRDETGISGFLVRVGEIFMYVRNRATALPHGGSLTELVKAASPDVARSMLDCEISLGRVRNGRWQIERSSLPFRVETDLAPEFSSGSETINIRDVTAAGEPTTRRWTIVDLDVDAQQQNLPGQGYGEGAFSLFRSMTGSA